MKNKRTTFREAFVFTRTELRGLRLLTFLLGSIMLARICYFRWSAPPVVEFRVPSEILNSDTISENRNIKKEARENTNAATKYRVSREWPSDIERESLVHRTYEEPYKRNSMVELNTADTIELRALPAIGPWLARKIVQYRERLGGFYSPEQLLEVFRLTSGKLDTIWPYVVVDTSAVRRMDINLVSAEDLMNHPYLSRSQAKGLIAYREKHGKFRVVDDLKKCLLIDEKTFGKLRKYVEVR